MRTVRTIMTPDPVTISGSATVREALETLEDGGIRHLPVVEGDEVVGMLSDRDLRAWRQALLDDREGEAGPVAATVLRATVRQRMTADPTCIEVDAPIGDAVEGLLERKVGALPVVEGRRLVGIVSVVDVLALLGEALQSGAAWPGTVVDLMTHRVFSVAATDPLGVALDTMLDQGVRHVPVVDDEGAVVGVVSHRDVLAQGQWRTRVDDDGGLVELARSLGSRRVEEVMSAAETVDPETPLAEAARLLLEGPYGCLPVVDNRRLVGILSESDFVRLAAGRSDEH